MTAPASRPGILASAKGALNTGLALLQTRLQLVATELEEEKLRLLGLLVWGAVAVLALFIGLIFVVVFVTVLLWDSHRLLALGTGSAIFVGTGLIAVLMIRRLIASAPEHLFGATMAELEKDRAALRHHFGADDHG